MNQGPKYIPESFEAPSPYDGDEISLRDYVQVLWRRRWWIAACFGLVVLAVGAWTLVSRPIYRADATLEIQSSGGQSLSLKDLFANQMGGRFQTDREVATEADIIKGRTVAEMAALQTGSQVRLDKSQRIYKKVWRRVFGPKQGEHVSPAGAVLKNPQEPLHAEALKVPDLSIPLHFGLVFMEGGRFRVITKEGRVFAQGRVGVPCETKVFSFILKGAAPAKGSRFGLRVTPLRSAARRIQVSLRATPMRNTRLIRLEMTDPDPYEAQRLLSGVVSAYRQIKVQQKTQVATNALDFINGQLQSVDKQLQQAVGKLTQYKEKHKLVNLDDNVKAVVDRLAQMESASKAVEVLRSQAKHLLEGLEGKGSVDQKALYTLGMAFEQNTSHSMLADLGSSLTKLQVQRAALRYQYSERHPEIQALDDQIRELKKKIRTEVSSGLASLDAKSMALGQEIKQTEAQLGSLPEAEQRLAALTRNAKVYEDTFAFMLQKKGEIQITRAGQTSDVWVAEPAYTNPHFIKPRLKVDLALGLVLGLMLGVGLAFFMEYLDDSVKNPEDIQVLGTLPVLGNIGHQGRIENGRQDHRFLALLEEPDSQVSEAFRSFRSNLLFSSVDKARQLIVLSSALPQDGKSTCAANLAVALAQTGKKVLLVDADLRRPVQHRIFRCRRSPGIVNVLVAEDWEKTLGEAIQASETNCLDLLVCGDTPPNPNEMLGSEKMGQVIDRVRRGYDFVVFDAAPILSVSDALVLARRVDGMLCVARAGRTSRKALRSTFELLAQVRTPVMGVVLNDVDFKRERYYYGYHSEYDHKYYHAAYRKEEENGGTAQRAWRKIKNSLAKALKRRG